MNTNQIQLVQQSWKKVEPIAEQAANIFYTTLFKKDPSLQALFKTDLKEQGKKLMSMIGSAVGLLNNLDKLVPIAQQLGKRHAGYGVKTSHYDTVGAALLETLEAGLGNEFNSEVKQAWSAVYSVLAKTMIDAANDISSTISNSSKGKTMSNDSDNTIDINYLRGAIDNCRSAIMMIDRDLIVTYINKSTRELFAKNLATFQSAYPGFDSSKIIGSCIDGFHKDPSHQRRMLGNPANLPHTADIRVGPLTFNLQVSAIYGDDNSYIGNILEWADVTEIRHRQIEIGRLNSAVNGMTTNLMMADLDGNIVYMNPAVEMMLRRRESQLRTALPSFSVDRLVGSNFDAFHKNPAHQRNLLGNPANLPYKADIKVAGLEFNLSAMALKDTSGKHIGSAVQWLDLTEERDTQRQIQGLLEAAMQGDLEKRINTSTYEGFMSTLGNGINTLLDTLVKPIKQTTTVMQSLAEGDLTNTLNDKYEGELFTLSNAINTSMENLRNMVEEISSAATNVFDAAREIAQGNADLSARTETQASNLEETASAMEELTTTVQQNAENAGEATKLANDVMAKANNGSTVVQSAVTAMEEINKSSRKIADIISVIDEIAFQTNLLALNAAVEAARAGEQGRGFAVVAAEVRNLAQRSAAAAKEIKNLISDSVEAVGKGTKLVDDSGRTFTELADSVQKVVTMISDINSASREQAAGINEIGQAVSQMDEMTQQNAALVEEASASSKAMEDQAQSLLEQVRFFNTGETFSKTPARRNSRPLQNAKPVTSRPPVSHSHKPLSQRPAKPVSPARHNDDEWEEF
jgi:methyl-accepting chemotaxis protein